MEVKYRHNTHVHNTTAANEVVPIVMELIQPASVIDVGCGIGTWLAVFEEAGVQETLGVDGEYVDRALLHIREEQFVTVDLIHPFRYDKKFDLVVSLEVAEHLPESAADTFVETLISLGDTILFSAAIPGQGGQNHLNEQWPDYWQTKFAAHGYQFHDVIREKIWWNKKVDVWYRQNMFLVSKKSALENTLIWNYKNNTIHPELFLIKNKSLQILSDQLKQKEVFIQNIEQGKYGVKNSLRILKNAVINSIKTK